MLESQIRERCPKAVPLAETMVQILRGIPGSPPAALQAWYEEACWARAAMEYGLTDLPEEPPVIAARMAGPIIVDEPAGLHGRRVAYDCAPVRMVYMLRIAAKLRMGDHPKPLPRTAPRVERAKLGRWLKEVSWCKAMLWGLGECTAYIEAAVTPPPYVKPAAKP